MNEVVRSIIKEKTWNLWVTGIIITDKDLTGQQVMDIPIVANRNTMLQYAIREVVDEVFILIPEEPDEQIQELVQRFEEMGITVDLNINLYELDVESGSKYLNRIGKFPTITFAQREIPYDCTETFDGYSGRNRWITDYSSCNDCPRTND